MDQDCRSCGNGDASWCTDCLDMFKQAWGDHRYKAGLRRAIELVEELGEQHHGQALSAESKQGRFLAEERELALLVVTDILRAELEGKEWDV